MPMKKIKRFFNKLDVLFRATDIGTYFVPMFRPMVTEQERLYPAVIHQPIQDENQLQPIFLRSSAKRSAGL
ncbi:hypothetical protein GCM10027341_26550 [Spirosoma knui]